MNEIQVFALIAEGENVQIEFKRELELTVARSKAEFIKDVIALANTAQDTGYLLVGVDDNKMLIGTRPLEEEQIVVSGKREPVRIIFRTRDVLNPCMRSLVTRTIKCVPQGPRR